ncbi:MAG: hypothetical protein IIA41_06110 [SAR324 cluster bacterium]|nr:hypothetical protein [SAR324 cluster bacterium]
MPSSSPDPEVIRTLAAILMADVANYGQVMGDGEAVKSAGYPTIEELLGFMRENSIPVYG